MSKFNLAGQISHFFTVNRPLSLLLLVVTLLFGLTSFFLTPKQYNPEITRPAFVININYGGATEKNAVDRIVYELVEKINVVPGVDDIYTEVHDGATINTTVIFEVGHESVKAKVDLLSQLEQHSYLARGKINQPTIIEINPETIPVLQMVFGSETLSMSELREQTLAISRRLSVVEGVSDVEVKGGYAPALVIEADPDLLRASNISIPEIIAVIEQSQGRRVITGVRADPYAIDVVYDGTVASVEAVGDLLLENGVRVREVARVYEGVGKNRDYVYDYHRQGFGEAVVLAVSKTEGQSAPVVTSAVLGKLEDLLKQPEFSALQYRLVGDDGDTAEEEIFGLTQNLLTSVAIVALVLLLFLSTRSALVVLITIPVTLLLVFGIGLLFGQTINRITLFALILSLGLLVDSAIVAVENIHANLKKQPSLGDGESRERAIAKAIDEIGVGLLLSMITSVIVFLPMNYITGMMGPYMGPIAFFVPVALIVSFLVAIVITPFVANHLLKDEERPNLLSRWFGRLLEIIISKYSLLLRYILSRRAAQNTLLLSALGIFLMSLILPAFGLVHFQMLPRADRDQFYVYLDLPVGTDREATKRVSDTVTNLFLKNEDVLSVQQFTATAPVLDFNGMFKGAQNRQFAHQSTLRVNLTTNQARGLTSTDIVTSLRQQVANDLPQLAPAIRFMEEPPGPPVRATLVAKLSADSLESQRQVAADFAGMLTNVSGVVDIYNTDELSIGRVRYELDRLQMSNWGVSPSAVEATLSAVGQSFEISEYLASESVEYTPILLTVPEDSTQMPGFIDSLSVKTTSGEMVSLRSFLIEKPEQRAPAIYLEDTESLSYITAEVEGRSIIYVTIEIIKSLLRGDLANYQVTDWGLGGLTLLSKNGDTSSLKWGGEWEMTLENFRDLGIAMGIALLLVYAVLVAQYRRFSTPAYILVTVPLGLVGILWGFFFLDQGFSIYLTATALIGFIALIGIVVNNAIIYLEYVGQARANGFSYQESLILAGEARLRPIFLTSLTTILGSLTIAGDPVWSGLAWAIVFGLSLSTVLTLIIFPTLLARFPTETE